MSKDVSPVSEQFLLRTTWRTLSRHTAQALIYPSVFMIFPPISVVLWFYSLPVFVVHFEAHLLTGTFFHIVYYNIHVPIVNYYISLSRRVSPVLFLLLPVSH